MESPSDDEQSSVKGGIPLDLSKSPQEPAEVSTPEYDGQVPATCGARQLSKLKRFFTTIQRQALDQSTQMGEKVWHATWALVNRLITPEQFYHELYEKDTFPLKPFIVEFLRANLPYLQRELFVHKQGMQNPIEKVKDHIDIQSSAQLRMGFSAFTKPHNQSHEFATTCGKHWQVASMGPQQRASWICNFEEQRRLAESEDTFGFPAAETIYSNLEKSIAVQRAVLASIERQLAESKQEIMAMCSRSGSDVNRQSSKGWKKVSKALNNYIDEIGKAEQHFRSTLSGLQPVSSSLDQIVSAVFAQERQLAEDIKGKLQLYFTQES